MLDRGNDQAAGLRREAATAEPSLLAFPVSAGDSGVWIAQLAHALRAIGARPVVLDAMHGGMLTRAFGLGNPRTDLLDMLTGAAAFEGVAQSTADGVYVLRAERGVDAFVASGAPPHQLFGGFARLSHGFDTLMLVMPHAELACLATPARTVPVISLEAGDKNIVASYSVIKQLVEDFGYRRFALVAHGHGDPGVARCAHERFAGAVRNFLDAEVFLAGCLPAAGAPAQAELSVLASTLLAATTLHPCTETTA
ncbi:MAG: hypothetical protein H7346_05930 [Burkholderiaceae bacterium]|nr:hypothetical protein [Burkholderiaceae bacterium]